MATSNSIVATRLALSRQSQTLRTWWRSGDPWIWMTAMTVGLCIAAVLGIVGLLAVKGLAHFWPSTVYSYQVSSDDVTTTLLGEISEVDSISRRQYLEAKPQASADVPTLVERVLVKTGNRQANAPDFRWVFQHDIVSRDTPANVAVLERTEWGNAYGWLDGVFESGEPIETDDLWTEFEARIDRVHDLRAEIDAIQKTEINRINHELEQIRLETRRRELSGVIERTDLQLAQDTLQTQYREVETSLRTLMARMSRDHIEFRISTNQRVEIPIETIVQAWRPNAMSIWQKTGAYLANLWRFLTEDPREANTEGGVFPALFGTVLMVLLMSLFVTPFGVVAALYLREYARQGPLVQLIRIAVNNLAGVPSIVYGVFGLGFFVYLIGGTIDDLFYPEAKPAPTFGTPGLIWASLTLALLTVPVVIVSTEEGLTRIPRDLRAGSFALGATKAETVFKVVLPMASPSILTGMILAVARAAGEVAPLMLVGVVKLAPALPIDGNFPFLHLERKFMHLGFHIYDVGFQSPNVDAARPLVFATALLLVLIIIVLNLTAITLRNRLEKRYRITK